MIGHSVRVASFVGALAAAGLASAAERLSAEGSALEDVRVLRTEAHVARTIDLGGDSPLETFVTLYTPSGRSLQRSNLGYWLPWDGARDSLMDNHLPAEDGRVVFKVLKQDISSLSFPILVTLAYRTADSFKFGYFHIVPE